MLAALVAVSMFVSADPPKEKEKELPAAAKKDLEKLQGVPMRGGFAKLPGVVAEPVPGFPPIGGRVYAEAEIPVRTAAGVCGFFWCIGIAFQGPLGRPEADSDGRTGDGQCSKPGLDQGCAVTRSLRRDQPDQVRRVFLRPASRCSAGHP